MSKIQKKILLVEDEDFAKEILSHYLSSYFEVEAKPNGMEAFKFLQYTDPPSLIITDVDMPIMDGFSLLKKLKCHERLQNIPVIILSSRKDREDRRRGLAVGAVEFLCKPFDPVKLQSVLRKVLLCSQNSSTMIS